MSASDARADAVMRFVESVPPRRYQRITLPDGRIIPGADRSAVADLIFPSRLDGRTVLDVGCDYGAFLHEAVRRGAARAVGVEADPVTHSVADRIASLWDGRVEIRHGRFPEGSSEERFDYVLCLNVLHHAPDPWALLRSAAARCRGILAVEFALPSGVQCWSDDPSDPEAALRDGTWTGRLWHRFRYAVYARAIERLGRNRALIGLGSSPGGQTFFMNEAAFRNSFLVHHRICERIEFKRSPKRARDRRIALCEVSNAP